MTLSVQLNPGFGHAERVPKAPRVKRSATDGRVERGNRTRRAIVRAHAALLSSGDMNPTAKAIAQKAGVSVRTVWTSFGDKESLYQASSRYWFERDKRLRISIDPQLPLDERMRRFCENRAKRLEAIAPAARPTVLHAWKSAGLVEIRLAYEANLRDELIEVFGPELPDDETLPMVLDAASSAVSWPLWSRLRDDLGRTFEQATAAMERLLAGVLAR